MNEDGKQSFNTDNEYFLASSEAAGVPQWDSATEKESTTSHKHGLAGTLSILVHPFTRLHQIPVFKRVWFYLALMAAYTAIVDRIADASLPVHVIREAGSATFGGVILGLLLVFRTNTAYERWSEGRKLWGQLVNDSRNLALKVRALPNVSESEKSRIGEMIISFAYALKHHLRDTKPSAPLPGVGAISAADSKNIPILVASKIFETLMDWEIASNIDTFSHLRLDQHARAFMDITGACERIRNSPLAVSYRAFMRQGIVFNMLALPWYIAPEFSIWWTMSVVLIAAYFLIGLELIAEDIEDPFGKDGDDLPLDNICANVRTTVGGILNMQRQQKFTRSFEIPRIDPLKPSK